MTDNELIGYCDIHSETPRALFSADQINRMIALAGHPSEFIDSIEPGWYSIHGEMKQLVALARERMQHESLQ